MSKAWITLWLAASAVRAQGADPDPAEVLRRVKEKVSANSARTPNYTCVQTVTRKYYRPETLTPLRPCSDLLEQRLHPTPDMALRHALTDRLRLDVTLTSHREIYSWAGASRFEDKGIDKLVRYGSISTGAFAGYLLLIFQEDVKEFVFQRRFEEDGRLRMEYSFRVPQADSHFRVGLSDRWVSAAYSGTFAADVETADVVRISVQSAPLPPETGTCSSVSQLEFAHVPIGGHELLLPSQTTQRFVHPNGQETENTTEFSQCREYGGESTIRFGDSRPVALEDGEKPRMDTPGFVPGQRFRMALTAPIDTASAAAGDPFHAKLLDPLRDQQGRIAAPKGSVVEGRLLRVQVYHWPKKMSVVVMQPQTAGGIPLEAAQWVSAAGPIALPWVGEEHAGAFRFDKEWAKAPKGYVMRWRIVPK